MFLQPFSGIFFVDLLFIPWAERPDGGKTELAGSCTSPTGSAANRGL